MLLVDPQKEYRGHEKPNFELEDINVLFMIDNKEEYIGNIISGMLT